MHTQAEFSTRNRVGFHLAPTITSTRASERCRTELLKDILIGSELRPFAKLLGMKTWYLFFFFPFLSLQSKWHEEILHTGNLCRWSAFNCNLLALLGTGNVKFGFRSLSATMFHKSFFFSDFVVSFHKFYLKQNLKIYLHKWRTTLLRGIDSKTSAKGEQDASTQVLLRAVQAK